MDSLQVVSGSSKSSSRSASPAHPLKNIMSGHSASPGPSGTKSSHSFIRTNEGSANNSGSTSTRNRRKSPSSNRRDGEAATSHIPHAEFIATRGTIEEPGLISCQDDSDGYVYPGTYLTNGSSEQVAVPDDSDGLPSTDAQKHRAAAIEHLQNKISRTKEQIRAEQTTRDDNVNEYLKLAANADKQQIQRIKSVFEKKNQKSAQIISQLQKKLEGYKKRIKDIESQRGYSSHRQPREMLRDVGQGLKNVGGNIRDGISGFSGGVVENIKGGLHGAAETVMSKPREFAHLLKNKFGSADNINSLSRNGESGSTEEEKTHHGSATLPGNCSITTPQFQQPPGTILKFPSDEGSPCSSVTSESLPPGQTTHHSSPRQQTTQYNLEPLFIELQERREEIEALKEKYDSLKSVHQEISYLTTALQEERFRCERLEEQINDLTELHQNEVENLKQTLTDMEEKVQYQSEERLRDIHEMLESCQTKISKMEHQQAQHQQYVTLEGIDNSNARALVVKLINVLLTALQVVLLLVATAAGIIMPFLKTRLRILSTLVLIGAAVFVMKQWPEVRDVGLHLIRHMKESVSAKPCLYPGAMQAAVTSSGGFMSENQVWISEHSKECAPYPKRFPIRDM